MAKFKYLGPEQLVGRFGKLKKNDIVDLWQSEVEFVEERSDETWSRVGKEDTSGVGVVLPTHTGGFDLSRVDWLRETRSALKRMSRTLLGEVAQSMREVGCNLPSEPETRLFSREHLFEELYGEAKRLKWDDPTNQVPDDQINMRTKVVPTLKAPAKKKPKAQAKPPEKGKRAHEEDGTFKADDPSTPDKNEAYVESDDSKEEDTKTKKGYRQLRREKK